MRDREGVGPAFAARRKQRANALFVIIDPLTLENRSEIVMLAATDRILAVYDSGSLYALEDSLPTLEGYGPVPARRHLR